MSTPIVQRGAHASINYEAPPVLAYVKAYDYDTEGNLIYEGWAAPGSATSASVWAIRNISYASGRRVLEQWADGNTLEDNIWDNRAALSYA
jgi:hypothetical protein